MKDEIKIHRILEKPSNEELNTIKYILDSAGFQINPQVDLLYIEARFNGIITNVWRIRKVSIAEGEKICNCGDNADDPSWWKHSKIVLRDNLKRFEAFEYKNDDDEIGVLKYNRGPFQEGVQDSTIAAQAIAEDVVRRGKALASMGKLN